MEQTTESPNRLYLKDAVNDFNGLSSGDRLLLVDSVTGTPSDILTVLKVKKSSIDTYGYFRLTKFMTFRKGKYSIKAATPGGCGFSLLVKPRPGDSLDAIGAGIVLRQQAAAEAAKKRQEAADEAKRAAEAKRLAEIQEYWRSEGRAVWNSKIEAFTIPGTNDTLTIFTRPAANGRPTKVCTCFIFVVEDRWDFRAKEEGREPRKVVHIQRGGLTRNDAQETVGRNGYYYSFYSGSEREYPIDSNWQAAFVFDEFGGSR